MVLNSSEPMLSVGNKLMKMLISILVPVSTSTNIPIHSLFVWLWLVVNDSKFPAGTVFFSHTNQPAVLLHEPAMIRTSQPNMPPVAANHFVESHVHASSPSREIFKSSSGLKL